MPQTHRSYVLVGAMLAGLLAGPSAVDAADQKLKGSRLDLSKQQCEDLGGVVEKPIGDADSDEWDCCWGASGCLTCKGEKGYDNCWCSIGPCPEDQAARARKLRPRDDAPNKLTRTPAVPREALATPPDGFKRIRNRWKPGEALHVETGGLQSGPIRGDWWSAMWAIERVAGTPYVRLRNRWKPDQYLHIEKGRIESSPIESEWHSAMWTLEPVDGYQRVRNRWKQDQYLHVEKGRLESGPVKPEWWSAMWVLETVR